MPAPLALKSRLRIPEGMQEVHVAPSVGRSSGEYKVSAETEALLKSVRDAAVAETRRDMTIQNLTREVGECTVAVGNLAKECTETNRTLSTVATTQEDHGRQLAAIWDEKKSKNSAWHTFWPTVVGSLLSAVILAVLAMSGAFTPKEVAAPPAPKTTPAP